ncbi:MAG TPA: carboxypeptidase regulatory-like domain-containing protein, partial [Kofleriaceae bacterium]|nr:carboxypeptidase regulatory-like domain-containing protein [Kofleriaceae bacterium]
MIRPWAAASLAGSLVAICAGVAVAQPARAIVTGRVVDAATGEPLPGVQLTAGSTVVFTDETGGFVLELPPGAVTLVVEAAYLRTERVELTLAAGEQRALDVPVEVDLDGDIERALLAGGEGQLDPLGA